MTESVVSINPNVMSGAPVFRGTRVPLQVLLNHIVSNDGINEDGIDDFFDGFPGVSRKQVIRFIEELEGAKEKILVSA